MSSIDLESGSFKPLCVEEIDIVSFIDIEYLQKIIENTICDGINSTCLFIFDREGLQISYPSSLLIKPKAFHDKNINNLFFEGQDILKIKDIVKTNNCENNSCETLDALKQYGEPVILAMNDMAHNLIGLLIVCFDEISPPTEAQQRNLVYTRDLLQNYINCAWTKNIADALKCELERKEDIIEKTRIIFDQMHDGLVVQNYYGDITFANESACRILGYPREELLVMKANDDWKGVDETGAMVTSYHHPSITSARENMIIQNAVLGVTTAGDKQKWLQISCVPINHSESPEDREVIINFADITKEKMQFDEMKILTQMAEAATHAKSDFLANMSHEIRTPLNGIIGICDILLKTAESEKQRELIEVISSSGKTLEQLISDILELSKVEAGVIEFENIEFALPDLFNNIVSLLNLKADEKGILLNLEINDAISSYYKGDPLRIKQIVINLMSNAIKFTENGSVTIKVDSSRKYDGIRISVIDTGIGINQNVCDAIFDRFTQADSSITRNYGGSGLGLSITKGLIEQMGGQVSVLSEVGSGTIFFVDLPLEKCEAIIEECNNIIAEENEEDQILKILLVEDNPTNRKVFDLMLSSVGAVLSFAYNGLEGVNMFRKERFDVILMDMQMPVMDGLTATENIRQIEKENNLIKTPILMVTANAGEDNKRKAYAAGADGFITKPATLDQLVEKIEACLYDNGYAEAANS